MLIDVFNRMLDGMYPDAQAAIVSLDGVWYFVTALQHNTKYFYDVHLLRNDETRHETLQTTHPVLWITESQAAQYGLNIGE